MSVFVAKSKKDCRWDIVSLGEVMLRLDPGEGRVATTRSFQVWEGGGEYNVARGLKRCFGMDAAVVTALADNAVLRSSLSRNAREWTATRPSIRQNVERVETLYLKTLSAAS